MTDSSSKLLQIQGKWHQERKPNKNPKPEKKWSENYSAPDGYGLVHQHCSNNCTCAKFDFTVGWESHPAILIQCATPSAQDAIQQPRDWHGRFPWPEVSLAAAKAAGLLLVWGLAPELSLSGDGDVNPAALIPSSPMAKDAKMMPENWRIPSARGCSLTYLETGSRNRIQQMSNCFASDFSFLSGNAVWGDIPGASYLDSADCRRTLLQWPFLELVATDVGSLSLLHSPHPAVILESQQCHPCHPSHELRASISSKAGGVTGCQYCGLKSFHPSRPLKRGKKRGKVLQPSSLDLNQPITYQMHFVEHQHFTKKSLNLCEQHKNQPTACPCRLWRLSWLWRLCWLWRLRRLWDGHECRAQNNFWR